MVQEVQQQGNWYQTPNLIPWVWISERKVKEHTQVTPSFSYECTVSGAITLSYDGYGTREGTGNLSIDSYSWDTKFRIINGGLFIPLAWAYLATVKVSWGTVTAVWTHKLKSWGEVVMSQEATTETVSKVINVGRGNVLTYWGTLKNSSSASGSSTGRLTVTLIKL